METERDFFADRKITVLGLGLLGRGVGDVEFLAKMGAQVLVTDKKSEEALRGSVDLLKKYSNVTFRLGGHDIKDFTDCDMVIKAAGVRPDSPEISAAKKAGIPVYMSTALFAKFATEKGARIVGVTGTRGKSTVTHMISHSLIPVRRQAGARVHLGGNIRGVSTLALLPEIQKGDVCVLELDSWQLQGFGDLKISPHISVFTNLMPDHQNYYASMDEYFADKANIFKFQSETDVLICGDGVLEEIRAARPVAMPHVPKPIPSDWSLQIPGEHNRANAALAAEALRAVGLNETEIRSGVETFAGVEGRLHFVGEKNGVRIYNDNNATTPEATIAALRALSNYGHPMSIILIMGGADKGLEMGALLLEITKTCKRVILLSGSGTSRVVPLMSDYSVFDSLPDAVKEAIHSASKGDIILFSPAFASFGMFVNEYDRNDQFMAALATHFLKR